MTNLRTLVAAVGLVLATIQFSTAQHWVPLANQPNANLGLGNPLLLTDGTVILHQACGPQWWHLTPDAYGSYVNGTWKRIASLPTGYAPLYFGSAVLPDGRVMMAGGEYNATKGNCQPVWTNQGAIYNPKTNKWAMVAPQRAGNQSAMPRALFWLMAPTCKRTAAVRRAHCSIRPR